MPISLWSTNPRGLETQSDRRPRRRREIAIKADREDPSVTRIKRGGDPLTTLMATMTRTNIDDDPMSRMKVMMHKIEDDPLVSPPMGAFPETVMDKRGDDPMHRKACPHEDGQMNRNITIDKTGVDPMNSKVMISKTDDDPMNPRDTIDQIDGYPMNQKAMVIISKAVDDQMNKMMTRRDKEDEGDAGQAKVVKRNKNVGITNAQCHKKRMRPDGENKSIVPSLEPGQKKLKNKPITLPTKTPRKAVPMKKEVATIIFVFLTQMD